MQIGNSNYSKQDVTGWMTDVDAAMTGNNNNTKQFVNGTGNTSSFSIEEMV